jgi:hypothetical protein
MYGLIVPGLCENRLSALLKEKNIIEDREKNNELTLFAKHKQFIVNSGRAGLPPIAFIHSNPSFSECPYVANITFAFSIVLSNPLSMNRKYFSDTLPFRFPSHAFFLPFCCFLFMMYSSISFVPTDLSGTEKDGIIACVVLHHLHCNLRMLILSAK